MNKIVVAILLLVSFLKADTITLVADEWCPYNCYASAKDKGFLVDMFTTILNFSGHKVEYRNSRSYEQAIIDVRKNKFTALIGATKDEVSDFIFADVAMSYSHDVLIIKEDSKWKYTSAKSYEKLILGVIKDYEYDDVIEEHLEKFKGDLTKIQMISGNLGFEYNINKLRFNKLTAMIEDELLFNYYFSEKERNHPYKIAQVFEKYALHIAFSPNNPKSEEYAKILSEGIKSLKGTQTLRTILLKYNLKEEDIYPKD